VLVCCDNEGCIVDAKGQRFDLPALQDLASDIAAFPGAFTICTGRAVPYVEAIVQVLGLVDEETPCVCEGGGVFYIPREDRYEAIAGQVDGDAIRALLPVGSYREELGKVVCYTAYPEPGYTVDDLYALVTAGRVAGVEVNRSIASVDVTPEGVDKMYGVRALLDRVRADWTEVIAIGDSWNDLPMLRAAGLSACPANAVPEVKAVVDYVSPLAATRGVADILRWAVSQPSASVK
jgi:hydroxymethylpyrimidine pyrophosphatase-like HAD family hydrolase